MDIYFRKCASESICVRQGGTARLKIRGRSRSAHVLWMFRVATSKTIFWLLETWRRDILPRLVIGPSSKRRALSPRFCSHTLQNQRVSNKLISDGTAENSVYGDKKAILQIIIYYNTTVFFLLNEEQ